MIELVVFVIAGLLSGAPDAPFFDDHERGWYWYEVRPLPPEETDPEQIPITPHDQTIVLSPRDQLAEQGKAWEDALALAVLEPSTANVKRYIELTAKINEQAHRFASAFRETIWLEPQLDYTLRSPIDSQAIIARNEKRSRGNATTLARIAQKAGLVFVFSSDCPVCHRFAPILKRFAAVYGFAVLPVSIDGAGLPEYPNPSRNHDFAASVSISSVPAVFLVDPTTEEATPVGYGYADWSTLTQKILYAATRLGLVDGASGAFVGVTTPPIKERTPR